LNPRFFNFSLANDVRIPGRGIAKIRVNGRPLEQQALIHLAIMSTNIWEAAKSNDVAFLSEMLRASSREINLRDSFGCTATHYAASHGSVEALRILIDGGADLTVKDLESRWTVLHRAIHSHKWAAAR